MVTKKPSALEIKFDDESIIFIQGEIKLLKEDAREITNRVDSLEMQLDAINKAMEK